MNAAVALVWACAVCGGGGPNRQAFIDTMLFMTFTPLLAMGGFAGFLWWRHKQLTAPPEPPSSEPAPDAPPRHAA